MKIAKAIAILMALVMCVLAFCHQLARANVINASAIVVNSPGGYVWVYEALGKKYRREGTKLIVAYCASACVLMLDLVPKENICFRASAWIGYHRDEHLTGSEPAWLMTWERGRDWINKGYREC